MYPQKGWMWNQPTIVTCILEGGKEKQKQRNENKMNQGEGGT